jgi:hypothetical protein
MIDSFNTDQIDDVLRVRWLDELGGDSIRSLAVEHPKRICLRVLIESSNGRHRWVIEAGLSRPERPKDEASVRTLVVNFLDAYLGDWFASERTERLTLDYATHEFEGREYFVRGRRRDLKADQLAAEFLGEPLEPDLEDFD